MVGVNTRRRKVSSRPPSAATHRTQAWQQIDWNLVEKNVSRLQARIVKATEEGRWGRVKALQRLLTHSFSGRAMAVRRVTSNRGKRTPGVDGEIWTTPARKSTAVLELQQHGYRPKPLRRVYIEKRDTTKKRPLGIPCMRDRAMQALYLLALSPIGESTGDDCSYGFRPERSTADAIERCFNMLAQKTSAQWILEGDLVSCFDRISHEWLEANIPMDKAILRKWLKAGFMDKSVFHRTESGTPQGGIASPVLANMALDGLQGTLREKFPIRNRVSLHRVNLVGYADDFIVTADSKEVLEREVAPLVKQFMEERGLELSEEKTVITHIDMGFDFLGQTVRKFNGKLLIKPSKKRTLSLRKVRGIIKDHKAVTAGQLIAMLNPVIWGWANYHRHVVIKEVFSHVDNEIWRAIWRWALRRHPNKSSRWVKKKYFSTLGERNWVFTGELAHWRGKKRKTRLLAASSVRILRHVLIQGKANPFDPNWATYFQERHKRKRRSAKPTRQRQQHSNLLPITSSTNLSHSSIRSDAPSS